MEVPEGREETAHYPHGAKIFVGLIPTWLGGVPELPPMTRMRLPFLEALLLLCFWVGLAVAIPSPMSIQANTSIPATELSALYDLYNATNGAHWLWSDDPSEGIPWNFTNPALNNPCVDNWQGVSCTFTEPFDYYHVAGIALPNYNLQGTLPSSLDSLTELRYLLLYMNQLSGYIPASLGNLTKLEILELDTNSLSGPIPDSCGNLTNMLLFDLYDNTLTGPLPESLNKLTRLKELYLYSNYLDGSLPVFDALAQLEGMYLFDNYFTGTVPVYLGHLPLLQNLELHLNRLVGALPVSLGLAKQLIDLRIDSNELTGTIPSSFSNLTLLQNFNLADNYIHGTVPAFLGSWYALQFLSLYSNLLTGAIPGHLGNLTYLTKLDLYDNYISGTIPLTLRKLSNLQDLSLYNNYLSGGVPSVLGNLTQLRYLSLETNFLTGTIPEALGNLSMLQNLILSSNFFSRSVPESLGQLLHLVDMDLHGNYLSGPIPASLGMILQLENFDLSNNFLSGPIPESLCNLENMYSFGLNNNQLTGSIPQAIGNFAKVDYFNLYVNFLSGSIPASVGDLHQVQYFAANQNLLVGSLPASLGKLSQLLQLFLFSNFLSGAIPESLGDLTQVQFVYLYDNRLSGPIPPSVGNLTQLSYLYLYANQLTGTLPESMSNMRQLQDVDFNSNMLSGTVPTSLGKLVLLQYFDLGENSFSGSIPASIGNLVQLQYFGISNSQLVGMLPESLGNLSRLKYILLNENCLSGSIPASWGNLSSLQFIYLFSNHLSGIIPNMYTPELVQMQLHNNTLEGNVPSFKHLPGLQVVLLHSNLLTGTIDDIFDPTTQMQIATVTLNNNQFSGTLPKALFQLNPQTFVGTSNCFEGPLPVSAMCENVNMVSLVIDGMSAASSCRNKLFIGSLSAYTLEHAVGGSIPTCLFQLLNITTLHLSGNGFTGSIPSNIILSDTLTDLSLSHNVLTGSIPSQIQQKEWNNIDLSYNRLSGTLSAGFASNQSIELENNRLSGIIPKTFRTLQNVSVLGSNTFQCSYDGSDLPNHDPGRRRYHCGSNSFDVLLYVWLGILSLAACILIYYTRYCADSWSIYSTDNILQNTHLYTTLSVFSRLTLQGALYSMIVLLPLYVVCSAYYSTQTYEYSYQISAVYMSGVVPFVLDWFFWILLVIAIIVSISMVSENVVTEAKWQGGAGQWELVKTFAPYLILDCIVVAGVNAAYVYVAVYKSSTLLLIVQTLLSFFKVVWGKWALPYILRLLTRRQNYGKVQIIMQIVVNMINNIAIPCLVVAVVSPNCFYNALVAAPTVTADVSYQICLEVQGTTGQCFQYGYVSLPTSYDPPFMYNYQCSASLVTYYSPAFVSMCIVSTFVTPLAQYLCQWLYKRSKLGSFRFYILDQIVPKVMKSSPSLIETPGSCKGCVNVNGLMTTIISFLGLVLTFGVVFPPLCVVFSVSIFATVFYFKANVSRFASSFEQSHSAVTMEILRTECMGAESMQILKDSIWVLVTVSCWFYTLFLFDTLGDSVGFEKAYWVLIVMPLMPFFMYIAYLGVLKYIPMVVVFGNADTNEQRLEVEMQRTKTEVHNVLVLDEIGRVD